MLPARKVACEETRGRGSVGRDILRAAPVELILWGGERCGSCWGSGTWSEWPREEEVVRVRWNHFCGLKKDEIELDGDGVRESEPDGDDGTAFWVAYWGTLTGVVCGHSCCCGGLGAETSTAGDDVEEGTTARFAAITRTALSRAHPTAQEVSSSTLATASAVAARAETGESKGLALRIRPCPQTRSPQPGYAARSHAQTPALTRTQALASKAAAREVDKDLDAAFQLYLDAARAYLHIAHSAQPALKQAAKLEANKALERAEKIKRAKAGLRPVAKDAFALGTQPQTMALSSHDASDEQAHILRTSARIHGLVFPLWDAESSATGCASPACWLTDMDTRRDTDSQPQILASNVVWRALPNARLHAHDLLPHDIVQTVVGNCSVVASLVVCLHHHTQFASKARNHHHHRLTALTRVTASHVLAASTGCPRHARAQSLRQVRIQHAPQRLPTPRTHTPRNLITD